MIVVIEVMAMLQSGMGWLDAEIARERYQTLLREAEIDQTMRRLREGETSERHRISERLGDVFIALGCRLKRVPVPRGWGMTSADRTLPSSGRNGASQDNAFF